MVQPNLNSVTIHLWTLPGKIAVKMIDDRGNELLVVKELKEAKE